MTSSYAMCMDDGKKKPRENEHTQKHWITRSFDYQVGETIKCKVCACF